MVGCKVKIGLRCRMFVESQKRIWFNISTGASIGIPYMSTHAGKQIHVSLLLRLRVGYACETGNPIQKAARQFTSTRRESEPDVRPSRVTTRSLYPNESKMLAFRRRYTARLLWPFRVQFLAVFGKTLSSSGLGCGCGWNTEGFM
jgi:hypothetical protein